MMMAVILKPVAHFFFIFLFFANVIDGIQNATRMKDHPVAHIHRDIDKESILECIVFELGMIGEPGVQNIDIPQSLICSTDNHGPTIMLRGDHISFFNDTLRPGVTSLSIPAGLVSASMDVDLDDFLASEVISISNEIGSKRNFRGRQTAEYHGFFKVLVVRVSDKRGHSPTYNVTEISNQVFSDNVSMASQYRACSNNQLSFTPALGGTDVKDGVVDVVVDFDLLDKTPNECVNAADSAITSSYDVGTSHSYIMYICPVAVDFGISAGIAMAGGRKSWYRDTFASSTFIQMHELGHNLGFHHSGEGLSDYGDPTCIMGAMYKPDLGWGRMCVNAVKTWRTGWYLNRHSIVTPTINAYSGELVDVNSVLVGNVNNTDDVVVKVEDIYEDDYYIMLHRLEGITSDMKENYIEKFANRVNIIRQDWGMFNIDGKGTTPPLSKLVGSLASGEKFCKDNWSNTRRALHIKVSSIAEKSQEGGAMISVFLGSDNSNCACQDSPLKIKVNFEKRNCAWVAKTKTWERCKKPGVASHCPFTCKAGKLCRADSEGKFKLIGTSVFQACSWVKRKYTKQRCQNIEGVASTCRATCAQFINEVILF